MATNLSLRENELLRLVMNSVTELVIILDENRQTVMGNRTAIGLLGAESEEALLGLRPGALLGCENRLLHPDGCGASEVCRECGGLAAILRGQKGYASTSECRLPVRRDGRLMALDLRVTVTPFEHNGRELLILSAVDISHEKRRRALERIFFHDLMNTATAVFGFSRLLELPRCDLRKSIQGLTGSVRRLIDEIRSQQELLAAEDGNLHISLEQLESLSFLQRVVDSFEVTNGRVLVIDASSTSFQFQNDSVLLGRVISNAIKNALEATQPGDTVTVGSSLRDGHIRFSVHNPGVIPKGVQHQIFQRSFSTKNCNRGLGTYSMKLLSENYLKGAVSFTTSEEEGTTFFATYPQWLTS